MGASMVRVPLRASAPAAGNSFRMWLSGYKSWDGDAVDESLWREIGGVWAGWRHGFADFVRSIAFLGNLFGRNWADHRGEIRVG